MARRALGPAGLAAVRAVESIPSGAWLVACSGGADSLALAWAAGVVARRRGTPVRAVVVDHGLQDGSAGVAAVVVEMLAELGGESGALAAEVVRVAVIEAGEGPEAAARSARYAALEAAVRPGERILLGHTLDDQAETVLLGLARGSGARALAGMLAERGVFLRPLLGLGREVTAACCAEAGLRPWSDPHNAETRFARVRVRERVLPVLERELGPGVREALARTAAQLRRDADALDALAADAWAQLDPDRLDRAGVDAMDIDPAGVVASAPLNCAWLAGLDPAVRDRIVRRWLLAHGARDLSAAHTAAVLDLVTGWRGQRGIDVPGLRVVRRDGVLRTQQR